MKYYGGGVTFITWSAFAKYLCNWTNVSTTDCCYQDLNSWHHPWQYVSSSTRRNRHSIEFVIVARHEKEEIPHSENTIRRYMPPKNVGPLVSVSRVSTIGHEITFVSRSFICPFVRHTCVTHLNKVKKHHDFHDHCNMMLLTVIWASFSHQTSNGTSGVWLPPDAPL